LPTATRRGRLPWEGAAQTVPTRETRTGRSADHPAAAARSPSNALLDLDGGACLFELRLDRVRLVPRDAFLDGLRSGVHQVLRLLEAETGDGAHHLDDLDLAIARPVENDVERGLLLRSRAVAAPAARRGSRNRDRSGGGDA